MRSSTINAISFLILSSFSLYTHALPHQPSLVSHLVPRTQDDTSFLGPNWDVTITPQAICLPIATAAVNLLDFYDSLATAAAQTPSPPLHLFRFAVRNLSMEFYCAQQPIPWWIVVHIANRMSDFVRKGWSAGEWELRLVNQAAQMAIIVGMKVAVGGLAPEGPGTPAAVDTTGVALGGD